MKNKKAISVSDAIDKYYKRNKSKLDNLFGSERASKSQLKNMPNIPANRFNDSKNATKAFNDFIDSVSDPLGHDLKVAKREAIANTPNIFTKPQELNKRINKNGYVSYSRYLGTVNGQGVSVEGFYEIKNSNYVLASMRYSSNKNTQLFVWEFLDKGAL